MKEYITNNFNKELVIISVKPPRLDKIDKLCYIVNESINKNKKVLFITLNGDKVKDKIVNLINNRSNINIIDKVKDEEELETIIGNCYDIVIIDDLQALPNDSLKLLHKLSIDLNIPIVVTSKVKRVVDEGKDVSFEINALKENNKETIDECDRYILLTKNEDFVLIK